MSVKVGDEVTLVMNGQPAGGAFKVLTVDGEKAYVEVTREPPSFTRHGQPWCRLGQQMMAKVDTLRVVARPPVPVRTTESGRHEFLQSSGGWHPCKGRGFCRECNRGE